MTDVRYDLQSTLAEFEQALSDCHRSIHAFERFGITAPPRYYRERDGIKATLNALLIRASLSREFALQSRELIEFREFHSRAARVA